MQKNFFRLVMVFFMCAFCRSVHLSLMTPKSCIPCILAANALRKVDTDSVESIFAIDASDSVSPPTNYILDLSKLRQRAREAALTSLLTHIDHNHVDITTIIPRSVRQRHDKRQQQQQQQKYITKTNNIIDCKYATLPVRHARAIDTRDDGGNRHKTKRRAADLTLCHFKICNMGRKRNQKFIHSGNQFFNDD